MTAAEVHLADLDRVAAFIAAVCRADAGFQAMAGEDVQRLPFETARGIMIIHEAVAAIVTSETAAAPAQPLGPWPPGYETKDGNVTVRQAAAPGAGM